MYTIHIGTHDIMGATITETQNSAIEVSITFFVGTNARGALLNCIYISDSGDINFERSALLTVERNNHLIFTINLSAGRYRILVYDIEHDGTLSNGIGYPAVADVFMLNQGQYNNYFALSMHALVLHAGSNSHPVNSNIENCHVNSSMHHIGVQCTYFINSVATGFQMIVQLDALDQVNKIYASKTVNCCTSAFVAVEENGLYQVSIIPILDENGITRSDVEYKKIVMVEDSTTTIPGI